MKRIILSILKCNMRICFLFIFFHSGSLFSQINEIKFSDKRIDSIYETTADIGTNPEYFIKGNPDGYWIVYLDSCKSEKIFEVLYSNTETIFYKSYFRNGQIKVLKDNKDNIEIGWFSNGCVRAIYNSQKNICVFTSYYENGMLKSNLIFKKDTNEDLIEKHNYKWDKDGNLIFKELKN